MEAKYAFEHGLPYSEFLDRWTNEDRALVRAVSMENADACALCGTTEWQWEADPDAYTAVQHVCPGCARKDIAGKDSHNGPDLPGSSIRLVPTAVVVRRASQKVKRPKSRRERARGK